MSFSTRHKRLATLALATASVVFTLVALEIAVRILRSFETGGGKERGEVRQYTEHDPRLGWRKRPGARAVYERREYTVEIAVNSRGLRDRESDYTAPPGTFRVLALGDSFVEGYSVPLEDTFCQVMERRFSSEGCPVEVLNGGTAAYSTDQELLFYLDEGARYGPQVVALFFYYNDVYANKEAAFFRAPKPLLAFTEGGPIIANEPVPKPPPPRAAPPAPARRPPRSFLWAFVRERLVRGSPRTYDALARLGLWEPLGGDEPEEELKAYKRSRATPLEEGWHQTARILDVLAREVARRGSRLVVVYAPSRLEVNDRDWDLTRLSYDLTENLWDRDLPRRRMRRIAQDAGFPLLDLTPSLRRAQGFFGGPYYVYDGHWNALGHRVVAAELARFLGDEAWLPPCATGRDASHEAR